VREFLDLKAMIDCIHITHTHTLTNTHTHTHNTHTHTHISDKGMGVGEFLDLKGMIDWCVKSGFKLLQLLPITDTVSHVPATPQDSYPYSSISVYALHPQYLRLSDVEGLSAGLKAEIEKKVKEFNDPHYFREKQWDADLHIELNNPVDFPAMMNSKSDLLHKMFSEAGAKTFQTQNYK